MVAEVAEYPHQNPAATVVRVRQIEPTELEKGVPTVQDMPVRPQHVQVGAAVEELRIFTILGHLAMAVGVFAAHGPTLGQVIRHIHRSDMAALNNTRSGPGHLIGRRKVVEIGVLEQRIQPIVVDERHRRIRARLRYNHCRRTHPGELLLSE